MDSTSDDRRVRRGEWPALLLSLAYFFCVLTAYYVLRPVREQFTAIGGSEGLPALYAATFAATLVLSPLFAGLVSRYRRRIMVPVTYGIAIACLLALMPLFASSGLLNSQVLGIVFYVWLSVFNLFVVSVFWIFMSDIWEPPQAARLFPVIAFAGTAGAIAGPFITRSLVEITGIAPLLAVSAGLLGIATLCSIVLGRWARDPLRSPEQAGDAPLGGGMLDGLRQVFANPFMRSMAILLLLADGMGTVNYALLADYARATLSFQPEAKTAFYANVDLASNTLTILLQLGVMWWLLPLIGGGRVLVIWAVFGVAALLLVALSADPYTPLLHGLPAVALASIVTRGIAYGMAEPARHSLFTRVPRNERYKGQNAVDTAVWRFGDMAVALLMNGVKAVGVGVAGVAAMGATAAGLAALTGWRLSRRECPVPPATA